jgi:hypothetical protein
MKTATDIQTTFSASTITRGWGNCFSCNVFIDGIQICEGLGSSIETAEDTAFYGAKISLCDN